MQYKNLKGLTFKNQQNTVYNIFDQTARNSVTNLSSELSSFIGKQYLSGGSISFITDSRTLSSAQGNKSYSDIFQSQLTSGYIWLGTKPDQYISTTYLSNLTYLDGSPVQNRYFINVGMKNVCSAWNSMVVGTKNSILSGAHLSLVNGYSNTANGIASHAQGYNGKTYGNYSHAEGQGATTSGQYSHGEGWDSKTIGNYSHAQGYLTITNGEASHSEGCLTITNGSYTHSEGYSTSATGDYSHAEGWYGQSIGQASHVEGKNSRSIGEGSHAEGFETSGINNYSHSEGNQTTTSGLYSHAEGSNTSALGNSAHAQGYAVHANGFASHAEGQDTFSVGYSSHAEGQGTNSNGSYSHAEGFYSSTEASYAHAEGSQTKANGQYSHAEGYRTKANEDCQHVEGKVNIPLTGYQKIVGGGYVDDLGYEHQANIYTLDWSGNAAFAGYISGSNFLLNGIQPNNTDGLVKLVGDKIPSSLIDVDTSNLVTKSELIQPDFTTLTNNTIQKNGHYNVTLTSNITLNAAAGTAGKTGNAQLFINPGSYTVSGGNNLTMVNSLTANKINYCTIVWYGTSARLYVIDNFDA